jgi:hypothetical protein
LNTTLLWSRSRELVEDHHLVRPVPALGALPDQPIHCLLVDDVDLVPRVQQLAAQPLLLGRSLRSRQRQQARVFVLNP